jgi:hypothetical protein
LRRIADLRRNVDALLGTSAVLSHLVGCCHGTHPIRIHIPQQRQVFWKSGFRMAVPAAARVRDRASVTPKEPSGLALGKNQSLEFGVSPQRGNDEVFRPVSRRMGHR